MLTIVVNLFETGFIYLIIAQTKKHEKRPTPRQYKY